jgi:diaminopimelate decarboxylase
VSEYPGNFGTISAAIDREFPRSKYPNLRCISEPGRYFAGSCVTIAAMVGTSNDANTTRIIVTL